MQRILISITFITLLSFLVSCTPIPKYVLPASGKPMVILYKKKFATLGNMDTNYVNVLAMHQKLCPEMKIIIDDRKNTYLQTIGYSVYPYKGKQLKFSYVLSFQGEKDSSEVVVSRIKLKHYSVEHIYADKKRKAIKNFNPAFEAIDKRINTIITELTTLLK